MKRAILVGVVAAAVGGCGSDDEENATTAAAPVDQARTTPANSRPGKVTRPGKGGDKTNAYGGPVPPPNQPATGTVPFAEAVRGDPEDDCGLIELKDEELVRILRIRGVGCNEALRVARAYKRGRPPPPWRCETDADHGLNFLACGHGGGDVRRAPHAFVGRIEGD